MKKLYFTIVFPIVYTVIYLVLHIFTQSQPQNEIGAGYLLNFIIGIPSSLIVAEFVHYKIQTYFIYEIIAGVLQYAILGLIIDIVRNKILQARKKEKAQFDNILNELKKD